MNVDDLGRLGETAGRYESERDIRRALEDRSSDPPITAFECLVRPSKPWLGKLLEEDERRVLGEIALERYAETLSVSPADYSDLLEALHDPYAFEWSPLRPLVPSPCGFGGSR